ncbi:hypothetical protein [Pandoraea sp. ISTKB]|uniref:hypothetical protein n=1 Tax=Pandoraea sp. ISTKB TaxID=1586708 RepID=UPI00147CBB4A|nr:hypothetical protein [Pandoraea sp. ISTKB]
MSPHESSELATSASANGSGSAMPAPVQARAQAADAMIERRYPSDVDRLREVVGTDVLPFYRDEQAIVAGREASERWPHLVAVADSRDGSEGRGAGLESAPRSAQAN